MKKKLGIILVIIFSFSLGFVAKSLISTKSVSNNHKQKTVPIIVGKVNGVGGVFFKCENKKKLNEWYIANLGFEGNQYGTRFEWKECAQSPRTNGIQWSLFSASEASYFAPSVKNFMINYTVDNLEKLVKKLKQNNVEFLDSVVTYEYGKFVHIMDIEGNKIELFEPNFEYSAK